jgi:ribosomal protein S18 acetylase RimI-like enzyme
MTANEYEEWLLESIPAYAADKVASGQWTDEESLARSKLEYEALLPQGLETSDNHFFTIIDAKGAAVGRLWFAVQKMFRSRIAYVFDVDVKPERQREGHAMRALADLEAEVEKMQLSGIALHVFGHNAGARALYSKLGYEPTDLNLYKPLPRTGN